MGNCCQVSQVIEIQENKSNRSMTKHSSHRSSSFIFDRFSKQKDFRKKYEYIYL